MPALTANKHKGLLKKVLLHLVVQKYEIQNYWKFVFIQLINYMISCIYLYTKICIKRFKGWIFFLGQVYPNEQNTP